QDIFLFRCPKTIDITGFFKKFCIATRTTKHVETSVSACFFLLQRPTPTDLHTNLSCCREKLTPQHNRATLYTRGDSYARNPADARSARHQRDLPPVPHHRRPCLYHQKRAAGLGHYEQ